MNEEYLKGLHGSLGVKDDYNTWVEAVKNNDEYLQGLHGSIGVNDDYDTWKSAVWGSGEVKKKEETTASPSNEEVVSTTSDTEPQKQVQSSDSSVTGGNQGLPWQKKSDLQVQAEWINKPKQEKSQYFEPVPETFEWEAAPEAKVVDEPRTTKQKKGQEAFKSDFKAVEKGSKEQLSIEEKAAREKADFLNVGLIGGPNYSDLQKSLEDKYSDQGFKFDTKGLNDGTLEVTGPSGEPIKVDVRNFKTEDIMSGPLGDYMWENKVDENLSTYENIEKQRLSGKVVLRDEVIEAADAVLNNKIDNALKKATTYQKTNQMFEETALKQGGELTEEQNKFYLENKELLKKSYQDVVDLDGLNKEIDISAGFALDNVKRRNEKLGTTAGALGNSVLKGLESLVSGAGAAAVTLYDAADEALQTASIMYGDDEDILEAGVDYLDYEKRSKSRKETIKNIQAATKDALVDRLGSATMDEYIASEDRSTLMKATQGVAQSIPAMATGFGGMFLQSFDAVAQEWTENPDYENMPLSDLMVVGGSIAVIQGALEKAGLSAVLTKNPLGKSVSKKIIDKVFGKVTSKITKKKFNDLIAAETNSMLANGVIKIVGGALVEGETGALQEIADIGVKNIYNKTKGESIFDTPDLTTEEGRAKALGQVKEGAKMEAIGGALMKGAFTAPQMVSQGMKSSGVKKELVDALHFMADSPELKKSLVKKLKVDIMKGDVTLDEGKKILNDFEEVAVNMRAIPNEIKDKTEAFDLIVEKKKLEKEMVGKEPDLVVDKKARVKEISEQLQVLATPGTEVEAEVKTEPAPKPKAETKTDQVSIHKENGGSSISQTGEDLFGKPGYSVSTHTDKTKTVKGKEVTQQELDQYKEDNKEALKDPNNFVGTWYDSKSDQTYIDIATKVENKQEAIELGKANNQKAIFDLESGTEIDTGGTGEVKQESTKIKQETQPATEESLKAKFKETKGEREQKVVRAAHKVTKSLKNIPGVKIFVHDSTDAYNSAIAKTTGESKESIDAETQKSLGEYIAGTGEIHINLENESTDATTVYHEAFHAIFEAKGIESGTAKEMVDGLKKIVKDKKLVERIDKFVASYETGEQSEEFMAEVTGMLSDAAQTLDANGLHKLITLINKIAKKIIGAPIFKATASRQEVLDFINKTATDLGAGLEVDLDTGLSEEINVDAPSTGKDVDTSTLNERKKSLIQDLGLKRQDNIKKRVQTGKTIKDFKGAIMHLTFSDRLVTGYVGDTEYKGGILFPAATGSIWAANKIGAANKIIKAMPKSEDGFRYLAPAIMGETAHMSNNDMTKTAFSLVEKSILDGEVSVTETVSRINKALKRKALVKYAVDFKNSIGKKPTSESVVKAIEDIFVAKGTFDERKLVLETVLGKADLNTKLRFGNLPSYGTLANGLAEPMTEGHSQGDVLLIIRTDGDLEIAEPKEGDADYHPSYKFTIRSNKNVETMVFDQAYAAVDLFPQVTNSKGDTYTIKDYENKYGDKGRDRYLMYIGLGKMSTTVSSEANVEAKPVKPSTSRKKQVTGYRAGDLKNKSETIGKFDGDRSTGHFGTGFYFFGKKSDADSYAKRTGDRATSEITLDNYNLADGTLELHDSLKRINTEARKNNVTPSSVSRVMNETNTQESKGKDPFPEAPRNNRDRQKLLDKGMTEKEITDLSNKSIEWGMAKTKAETISEIVNKKLKDKTNKDTASTLVMKELGFEGVDSRGTKLDNAVYGSVVYDVKPSVRKKRVMPKNESEKLTEDKDGNYYFENFAHSKKTTLKPSLATGVGIQTSKEERNAINSVGGLTMLYTMSGQTEKGVGTNKHKVVIPKDKVYYIQDDVNNYYDEAKRQFSEARPGQAFNPNYQGAWITKVANENGYDIAITKWRGNELRAQTTLDLTPTESDTEFGPRFEDSYKVGDDIVVYGTESKVVGVKGDVVSFKNDSGAGTINVVRSKRSVRKKQLGSSNELNKAVTDAKEKYNISVNRGNTKEQAITSAVGDLKKSDWYSNTDDIQREQALRKLDKSLGVKQKSAPSVAKTLGKAKDKVTVNERVALRELIQREVRAAREGAKSEKDIRKAINNIVTVTMAKMTGKIPPIQVRLLVKRALTMNLSNPVMAERFISYVGKVAADSEYEGKLQIAYKARAKFKKLAKSPSQQHELKAASKEFSSIDPILVEDIDAYIESAEMLKAAMTSSRVVKGEVKYRNVSGIKAVNEYTANALENQEQMRKNAMEIEFSDLFEANILNSDMSLIEMKEIIEGISRSTQQTIKNEEAIREQVKNSFESYASIIEHIIKTNTDPFSGEEYNMSDAQRKAIGSMLRLDIDSLSLKELFQVVDLISNFTVNNAVGNIEAVANRLEGRKLTDDFYKKHGSSMKMNVVGRGYARQFMSLTMLMDNVFASARKSIDFFKMSGLGGFVRGANYAQRVAEKTLDRFADKFHKTKPNGESFNTAKNTYERGMYSFLLRNAPGTDSQIDTEFRRRVRLVEETITYLTSKKSTAEEKQKGEIYKELYTKLGVGDIDASIESITKATAKENVEAVQWWINEWSNHYGDLKDVTSSVYNKDLGYDTNYTTDKFKKRGGVAEDIGSDIDGAFVGGDGNVYHKEAGVLMAANKPRILPSDRFIDLDFDANNYTSLESALVDINTAADIQKLIGFINSESFNDIFNAEDRDLVRKRITQYILRKRKKEMSAEHAHKMQQQVLNMFAKASTSLALGSIAQLPKQTLSVIANTMVNAVTVKFSLTDAFNKDMREWLDNTGMPISRRGVEADVALDFADKNLKKYAEGKKKAMDVVDGLSNFWLNNFLAKPDRVVAIASFFTYYKKNLKGRGLSTDIDFKDLTDMDQEALDYAQHMVDRQQNISDSDMAGDFFTSKGDYANLIKKVFFPFANFIMNQKSRMISDLRTIGSKTNTLEDKGSAIKSIGGLVAEMLIFHSVSGYMRGLISGLADMITGYEPEEEDYEVNQAVSKENKEREENGLSPRTKDEELIFRATKWNEIKALKKKKTLTTSIVKDIFSPVPLFDDLTVKTVNKLIREEKELRTGKEDEDVFQLWDFGMESYGKSYGTVGIVIDKYIEASAINLAANEGVIEKEGMFGKKSKKYLTPEDQEIAKINKWVNRLYLWGVLPADAGSASRRIQRNLSKSGLTEIQMEKYKLLVKEQGSVSEEDLKDIKKNRKVGSEKDSGRKKRPQRKRRPQRESR